MRRAIGLMAGPQRPPVRLPRNGLSVSRSRTMALNVLTSDTPSDPASTAARATAVTSLTLGVSLVRSRRRVSGRTAPTTAAVAAGSAPICRPLGDVGAGHVELVAADVGHARGRSGGEVLLQRSHDGGILPRRVAADADDDRLPRGAPTHREPAIQAAIPGFSSPMALIMPAGVSVTRGGGLPVRASSVTVLGT